MTQIILTILFFAFNVTNAQIKEASETELYEKAERDIGEYYEKYIDADSTKLRIKAYKSYSLLVSKFPKLEKSSYYLYTIGSLTYDKEESKKCFKEVIRENNWEYYIRKSYISLAFYATDEKDFKTELKCIEEIKKMKNPTFTFRTEMKTYNAQLKNLYTLCEAIKK